ncbi:N-acetylglucosamine/diacetylchitobiose ABC transporter substrate-binding protein [Fodinicola feengrottensis]|uniref:N-acetylglucosamine/diacetylchitobiose ABC transporter substrate-binding protein n=1 Tax=Fodinicola feengrottensis TaxID=435914 RepID=UPI0024435F24|nr:N-acetylglucosamine/diacetylchitobiose ABC transporter substrate-binding protein [Fodinicola feengrottensis]
MIFKGGYGDKYALDAEAAFKKKHPKATVKHNSTQQITQQLAPRFVGSNPPDLIDNSGAQALDMNALIGKGQVADLTPLLDAPSLDDPSKKIRDTLRPGIVEAGQYGGKEVYALNYVQAVFGIWYSSTQLTKYGIQPPQTWQAMLDACATLKKNNVAGWTYAGKYPGYVHYWLFAQIAKVGGKEVLIAIDNLEPNAWKHPAVKAALEPIEEVVAKGYVLQGSEGLTHIESQTAWNQGKAAFIPNGSWVENEAKGTTPANFGMAVQGPPSVSAADKMPFGTIWSAPTEPFIVPKQAMNSLGGMEMLRVFLAKPQAQNFARQVSSLTCVLEGAEGVPLPPGVTSANAALKAAGANNTVNPLILTWYAKLVQDIGQNCGLLMSKRISAADWITKPRPSPTPSPPTARSRSSSTELLAAVPAADAFGLVAGPAKDRRVHRPDRRPGGRGVGVVRSGVVRSRGGLRQCLPRTRLV